MNLTKSRIFLRIQEKKRSNFERKKKKGIREKEDEEDGSPKFF